MRLHGLVEALQSEILHGPRRAGDRLRYDVACVLGRKLPTASALHLDSIENFACESGKADDACELVRSHSTRRA
jgi:hypothetical protein